MGKFKTGENSLQVQKGENNTWLNNPIYRGSLRKRFIQLGGGGTLDWLPESQNVARLQCSVYFHQDLEGGGEGKQAEM